MKKKIIIPIATAILIVLIIFVMIFISKDNKTDAEKFSEEYTQLSEDNLFVYRNSDEIIKILEKGTGIVFLGFPECQWCQRYVVYLNDVAKKMGVEKIYYFNIKEDREKNTKNYRKIVAILSKHLDNDEEGKPRVFVPDVAFVLKGKIVGHDNESSLLTKKDGTPNQYWDKERVSLLKARLSGFINEVNGNSCNSCD